MSRIVSLVDRIEAEYGEQFPGATEQEMTWLAPQFEELFGIALPAAYAELLRRTNGFDFDGLCVYGTHDLEGEVFRFGIVESNQGLLHGMHDLDSPLRFFGERDDQLLAYDTSDQAWELVDRYSWDPDDPQDVYGSFEKLMVQMLEEAAE